MDRKTLRGRLVTDYEVLTGASLTIGGDSIKELDREGGSPEEAELHDYGDSFVLPGFVDLQVNGCSGIDVATDPGRLPELSEKLLSTGTTSYLPTLISCPENLYEDALTELAKQPGDPPRAEALGAHLEGPFINPEKRGAHPPEHVLWPDPGLIEYLSGLGPIRMITLAPELEGAEELFSAVADRGVTRLRRPLERFFRGRLRVL